MKTRALVQFMGRLGYRVSGLGERDLDRGYEYLDSLHKLGGFPFVSANVVYQRTGKTVFDPYVVLTLTPKEFKGLQKTVKVGITSFLRFNPTFLKPTSRGDNMILSNALDEAKRLIPELRDKCDLLVVLGGMPKDDAHLLARTVKGIDVILAAYGGMISGSEEKEGATRIVYLGNQGKYLAEIRALRANGAWETNQTLHYLGATYPEEQKAKDTVASVLAEINDSNKKIAEQRAAKLAQMKGAGLSAAAAAAAGAARTYLGSEACKDCHGREYEVWKMSKHAHAFDILVQKKADFNPECVVCHVLGFRERGGFEDAKNTPELVHVQCESCHGPASTHPDNPTAPYGKAGGEAACKPCHKAENSPAFEFSTYWPRIKH